MTTTIEAERLALLATILAHPEEDVPRLIYADWLEEHQEAERAELIRLQAKAMADASARELDLKFIDTVPMRPFLRTFGMDATDYAWNRTGATLVEYANGSSASWSRGFIDTVSCTLADWIYHGPAICREHPVTRVTITDRTPNEWTRDPGSSTWDYPTWFSWYRLSECPSVAYPAAAKIDDRIYNHLSKPRNSSHRADFETEEAARLALSKAAIAWARSA